MEDRRLLAASVFTDKQDYQFGETVFISGTGFQSGEDVQLQVRHSANTSGSNAHAENQPWNALADSAGNLQAQWFVTDPDAIGASYVLLVLGLSSGNAAATAFTDSVPPIEPTEETGSITIVKDANPDHPQDFSFTGALGQFVLDDDADPTLSNTISFTALTPQQYSVSEAAVAGWNLLSVTILGDLDNGSTVNLATRTVDIDLDAGEHITLIFRNFQRRGSISVVKDATPDSAQDFSFTGTLGSFLLDDDADPTLPNNRPFTALLAGAYTISEDALAGWDLTNIVITGDVDSGSVVDLANRSVTIDLDPGENITVTFANTQRGRIIVEKETLPGGSPLPVEFARDFGANFLLAGGQSIVFDALRPGAYSVQEIATFAAPLAEIVVFDPDNGTQTNVGNLSAAIDLDPGETVRVIFVNGPTPRIVVGPDKSLGSRPVVDIINAATGQILESFLAYDPSYFGGVRIATGDLDGDGVAEIITAPGRNHLPLVRIFDQSGTLKHEFLAFDGNFLGGVDVAVGDVDGDGRNDIIAGMSFGGSAVRVFRNLAPPGLAFGIYKTEIYPFGPEFLGGVVVAAADMGTFSNGAISNPTATDGKAEIIVGNEAGLRSTVSVIDFSGATPVQVRTFLPFDASFRGGISLDAYPINADAIPEIIVGAGNGGRSAVTVLDGLNGVAITSFAAYGPLEPSSVQAPLRVAALDSQRDGRADSIVVVQGTDGATRLIRFFDPLTGALQNQLIESDPNFAGAYFVASLNSELLTQPESEILIGSTSVSVVQGDLLIEGDEGADTVKISGTGVAGQYLVTTHQGTQTVNGITGSILVNLHDGDDELIIDNAFVARNISIDTGDGNDVVRLGADAIVSSAGDLQIELGDGDDVLNGQRLYIGGAQTISGGQGDDQLTFAGSYSNGQFVLGTSSRGATVVSSGPGNDRIDVRYSFIVGQWTFNGGAGDDTIRIDTSACIGDVVLIGGEGNDLLVIDTNYFLAAVVMNGNAGNDQLRLANSLGIQLAVLVGEEGNDFFAVSHLTAHNLQLDSGAGDDSSDVRSSSIEQFFAQLGDGNDSLTLYGNLIRSFSDVDGGAGGLDRLFDLGGSLGTRGRGFELFMN